MEWLSENWFLTVLVIAFVLMHFFGHGHHGKSKKDTSSTGCSHSSHEHDHSA